MIYGLDSDYYCAHTPIPVQVSPTRPEWGNMEMLITNGDGTLLTAKMYQINGFYYIDLSPWVKAYMNELRDNRNYYKTVDVEPINDKVTSMTVSFVERDPDQLSPDDQFQTVIKYFVQCALYEQPYTEPSDKKIKVWEGYPISLHNMQTRESLYRIITSSNVPNLWGYTIEFTPNACKGSYLKWFNEYGGYNYWYFGSGREEVAEGDNIFDTGRNVFGRLAGGNDYMLNTQSNFDTVGFEGADKFTVRDMVKREYWHLFKSLATSPEVYILKNGWIEAYLGGETNLTPNWWIKVRQIDFEFNRKYYTRSMAEVEIELEYPKPYSQKRI